MNDNEFETTVRRIADERGLSLIDVKPTDGFAEAENAAGETFLIFADGTVEAV